jgi:hypothetical protein
MSPSRALEGDTRALLAGLEAVRAGVSGRCAAQVGGPGFALVDGDGTVDDLVEVGQLALDLRADASASEMPPPPLPLPSRCLSNAMLH